MISDSKAPTGNQASAGLSPAQSQPSPKLPTQLTPEQLSAVKEVLIFNPNPDPSPEEKIKNIKANAKMVGKLQALIEQAQAEGKEGFFLESASMILEPETESP